MEILGLPKKLTPRRFPIGPPLPPPREPLATFLGDGLQGLGSWDLGDWEAPGSSGCGEALLGGGATEVGAIDRKS